MRKIKKSHTFIILLTGIIMHVSNTVDGGKPDNGRIPTLSSEQLKNLPADGGEKYNRLIFENSPYLLQHARNPVDWRPWNEEAFAAAKQQNKPIFLSIGYATCHWCHVMEHESFEDEEVAALMNDAFICIKVDREERPDIDQVYMAVCQAITGSGGWPLTIIMTPEKKPFFAATYLPRQSNSQRIGMLDLAPRIKEAWKTQPDQIKHSTERILSFLQENAAGQAGDELHDSLLQKAFDQLAARFDAQYGGFGSEPKFPSPHNLTFLLRHAHRTGNAKAMEMVEITLRQMRLGGIFDHVGFGFHRYATDRVWLLPHFEKMLYDQAMLSMAYTEAYLATGKAEYAQTVREILTYVSRDMTSPEGGFYSAEDADSDGEEGLFYFWRPEELTEILGAEDAAFFIEIFNVEKGGNFADQATQQRTGDSILHLKSSLAAIALEKKVELPELQARWENARRRLFNAREKRIHPLKDDKILTDWNGLMIAAFAKAGAALNEQAYTTTAQNAARFILSELRLANGLLLKRYRNGNAGLPAHADDYAFMIWGLLELYEATFEVKYLQEAVALNEILLANFWDHENGGLFFSADSLNKDLLVRNKESYDGAIPSANSVHALNLIRLSRITGNENFEQKALQIGAAFSKQVTNAPGNHTQMMSALDFWSGKSYEVVIVGKPGAKDSEDMIHALRQTFKPNKIVLFKPTDQDNSELTKLAPFIKHQASIAGKATAFICYNFACKAPTTELSVMLEGLRK